MARPKPTIRNLAYLQRLNVQGLDASKLSEAFEDVSEHSGNLGNQIASNPDGKDITPPNIGQLEAQHLGGGYLNWAITDNASGLQRSVDYVVEIANNSSFSGSEVAHFSPSRNGGTNVPNGRWWIKAYSQYRHGGPPSGALIQGPITVTGSTVTSARLGSQGCGTGAPGATGQGAGLQISR